MEFENSLKALIKERYGSISAFAKKTGLPYSTIDNIFKRGIMGVSIQVVLKLCSELNIDVEEIREGRIKEKLNSDDKLSMQEQQLIHDYRSLSDQGQEYIRQQMFMAKNIYQKKASTSALKSAEVAPQIEDTLADEFTHAVKNSTSHV